jgi:hypothetical protein
MGKRKHKKRKNKSSLSARDEMIYNISYLLVVVVFALSVLGGVLLRNWIIFRDSNVIAYRETLWCSLKIVPMVSIPLVVICKIRLKYIMGIPLFSKPKMRIFSKDRLAQRILYGILALFIAVNLACLLLPFYSKIVITSQGDIIEYSITNKPTRVVNQSEITQVELEIHKYPNTPYTMQRYVFKLSVAGNDGNRNSFDEGSFRNVHEMVEYIDRLIKVNGASVQSDGEKYFSKWEKGSDLSEMEKTLLENIFSNAT